MTFFKNWTQLETFTYLKKSLLICQTNKRHIVFYLKCINAALQPKSTLFPLLFYHEWENFSEHLFGNIYHCVYTGNYAG